MIITGLLLKKMLKLTFKALLKAFIEGKAPLRGMGLPTPFGGLNQHVFYEGPSVKPRALELTR